MITNYNRWFYQQHKYLTGTRKGKTTFNDTKWININKRYKTLIDLESELLNDQPFGIMGNNKGFDKLIDLMERSNYTFDDINSSLIDTYKFSYKNAMSSMLVNTHAIMFHCTNNDDNVTSDAFTHYYIIEVPFDQLHFGDRDEFIRQKLHEMHTTENKKYVDINTFISGEFTRILGFTILCTVNGFICNDCKVAIDDKGFKFKVGWKYSSDVDFIIYKLDESFVTSTSGVSVNRIPLSGYISYDDLGISFNSDLMNIKCIVDIYDPNFTQTVPVPPNFGYFTEQGLYLPNVQKRTFDNFDRNVSSVVNITVIGVKYLHELPDTYPACNYKDLMDSRQVYTDKGDKVTITSGQYIISSDMNRINELEICTPPITLDRDVTSSFDTIKDCLKLYTNMMTLEASFKSVGSVLRKSTTTDEYLINTIKPQLQMLYEKLNKYYIIYQQGALLTSLVDFSLIEEFYEFNQKVQKLSLVTSMSNVEKYTFDELYDDNYKRFVKRITNPFRNERLLNFIDLGDISYNYFPSDTTRFNRPVAEQCLIALRYHRDEECWLFDYHEIKHFKGIGNTFYIDTDLRGDEVFKFFVLYTDTNAPSEKNIDNMSTDVIKDFDLFCDEVDKHMGYIRYWYAENKLLKLSEIMFNRYSDETCIEIFSKMLKNKIDGKDILKHYPSEINYELSNITSDSWDNFDEYSDRSPFAINFMFYTLSMLMDNEDKMQTYFFRTLVGRKFDNRYIDVDISPLFKNEDTLNVNFSKYYICPNQVESDTSEIPDKNTKIFYGIPIVWDSSNYPKLTNFYRYVFNECIDGNKYYLTTDDDVDKNYYLRYSDISTKGSSSYSYHHDITLAKYVTKYLSYIYDSIQEIQTDYRVTYNKHNLMDDIARSLDKGILDIYNYYSLHSSELTYPDISEFVLKITEGELDTKLNMIDAYSKYITKIRYNDKDVRFVDFINAIVSKMKYIYVNTGFDNAAVKRIRKLYIHLKKIDSLMGLYEYRKWLENIDLDMLSKMDDFLAENENYNSGDHPFKPYYETLSDRIPYIIDTCKTMETFIDDIYTNLDEFITPMIEFVQDIIHNYIFDMFIVSNVTYDISRTYSTKPEYVTINVNDVRYTMPPVGDRVGGNAMLLFKPILDKIGNNYVITEIDKVAEYCLFYGDKLSNLSMTIYDERGSIINTIACDMTFSKVSNSSDLSNTFQQLYNIKKTMIEFENTHESFTVENDKIVNSKFTDMNYELLLGNHFTQLDHVSELVLKPVTYLQGSVDRIFLSNQEINSFAISDYGNHNSKQMYFKPSQVIHIPIDENDQTLSSIGGKYFVGQRLYAKTKDGLTVFPITVTAIDHGINKGFIEAIVDDYNSKWFAISDDDTIDRYLTTNIECEVVDDNICNFLDEYSNSEYETFYNPDISGVYNQDDVVPDAYTLPGDPIYVSNNSEFVYTRLNYFFNELVPNRFIDENHKKYRFNYLGDGFILNTDDTLTIKMINRVLSDKTNPEIYPILRTEPDDHDIWEAEIQKFQEEINLCQGTYTGLANQITQLYRALAMMKTQSAKESIMISIEGCQRKQQACSDRVKRLQGYINQLETPTTWYNVHAYEDTLVYIQNGRADKLGLSYVSNIRDIPYTDKLDVYLYDWEHKYWIDPSLYSISTNISARAKIDEYDDYYTKDILESITITPNEGFVTSKKILVYIAYNKSDIFDDIELHDKTFYTHFKPFLSVNETPMDSDIYSDIRIRKHFDGYEKYVFESYSEIDDFSLNGYLIKRPMRSDKYTYAPMMRFCDISGTTGTDSYSFSDFDMYVRIPFKDIHTNQTFKTPKYSVMVNSDIDDFVENQVVKLICVSNNDTSSFNGVVSTVMFTALTKMNNNKQSLTILNTSLSNIDSGKYVCTVFRDDRYKSSGGVITVTVSSEEEYLIDEKDSWIKIPESLSTHRELPNEFILVPKTEISDNMAIILSSKYQKTSSDIVSTDNSNTFNPYEYYFDTVNRTKLPISDTRRNMVDERLVIDTDNNPDIKLIKSTYVGVCRYSLARIPEDGIINVLGYIPTPLSRDRYEFWVNGRYIKDKDDIVILSPTSFQLKNLKSLKNFELIELVDDYNVSNELLKEGNLYIGLDGKIFSSYKRMLLSDSIIKDQYVGFVFDGNIHQPLQDISTDKPNNYDYETDILESIIFDESVMDYNQLVNVPSINGIDIYHPTTTSLGIMETPNTDILSEYDKIWKMEIINNPLFDYSHRVGVLRPQKQISELHVKQLHSNILDDVDTRNSFVIYATGISTQYFTLYISKISDGKIDDTDNTIKIIPFINNGTYVLIDKSYQGYWLHSSDPDVKPVRLVNVNNK